MCTRRAFINILRSALVGLVISGMGNLALSADATAPNPAPISKDAREKMRSNPRADGSLSPLRQVHRRMPE